LSYREIEDAIHVCVWRSTWPTVWLTPLASGIQPRSSPTRLSAACGRSTEAPRRLSGAPSSGLAHCPRPGGAENTSDDLIVYAPLAEDGTIVAVGALVVEASC
jgi:hypothetical protein